MWKYNEDTTKPIITAKAHIESGHKNGCEQLPSTAVLFYMHGGIEYMKLKHKGRLLSKKFPRFLNACPIYKMKDYDICFLDGGRGAPQAVDTLETLAALGVKNVITIGMFGAFGEVVESGDIIIPNRAFVEEGTSLHYYDKIEYAEPNAELLKKAAETIDGTKALPIVSTDAVYRQTFFKEALWREKGAVGVDMETSALYSVGALLDINVVSILIASDKHPLNESESAWKWTMKNKVRFEFFDKCIEFAKKVKL